MKDIEIGVGSGGIGVGTPKPNLRIMRREREILSSKSRRDGKAPAFESPTRHCRLLSLAAKLNGASIHAPQSIKERLVLCGGKAPTVERVAHANLPTELGMLRIHGYRSLISNEEFVAVVRGELRPDRPTLVRIHSQCLTGDVFGSVKCDCGRQLRATLARIADEDCGVIIYQQQEGRGIGILNKIRAYALQDEGADTIEANECLGLDVDRRQYEQCAEVLLDLGLRQVRVLSNNPMKIRALEQSGLKVVARVALEIPPTDAAAQYLRTKKERMGHLLELV